jgi:hypothetical protein
VQTNSADERSVSGDQSEPLTVAAIATSSNARTRRTRILFVMGIVFVYAAVWVYTGALSFPIYADENQFWRQTKFFADAWPPTLDQIRDYPEPMTPLSFLIWGFQEHVFEAGITWGRHFNFCVSFVMLLLIGLHRGGSRESVLAAVGLIAFPYFIPMGMHLYTDILAAFFVLLGFRMPGHSLARSAFFVLAIATRQYMVAFPAALVVWEVYRSVRIHDHGWWRRALPDFVAAASLLGWIAFFGGLGPEAGLISWPRHTEHLGIVDPMLGLYFFTTVGIYFVAPEFLLYRRWNSVRDLVGRKSVIIALVLIVLFVFFPPIFGHLKQGLFGRACHYLPVPIRMTVFFFFAWLACVRFSRISLPFWLLLAQVLIILNAWSAWEKYALPLLAVFWFLKVTGEIDEGNGFAEITSSETGGLGVD